MNRIVTTLLTLGAALGCVTAQAEFKDFSVNGQVVSRAIQQRQADQIMASAPNAASPEELEARVRDWLTRVIVVSQWAQQQGLDKDPNVTADLRLTQDYVLYNAAATRWIQDHPVAEAAIREVYDRERAAWGDTEYSLSHIMLDSEAEAREVIAALGKGEDFGKLAREKSRDGATGENGGSVGWQSASVLAEEFRAPILALKPGEFTKEPLKSALGWHVIRLDQARPAELFPSYEDRKPEIERELTEKALNDFIEARVAEAQVK